MRHIAFFRGICGKQLFSPCFIRFAQLRRISQNPQQITARIKAVLLRRFNQAVTERFATFRYYYLMHVYARVGLTLTCTGAGRVGIGTE